MQSDKGLHCLLTEPLFTVQLLTNRRPRSDCTDTQVICALIFCIWQNGPFVMYTYGPCQNMSLVYADSEGPDQPAHLHSLNLHCLLTESLDTTECMNGEQRLV